MYYNSGYADNYDLALAWTGGSLSATYNNNASHNFWSHGAGRRCISACFLMGKP